ncbi:LOW QUALITY PROTEIN: sugar phosphate isomerase/epimerase [Geomicrobium sp. JCM 19037]|nr:LOW QUALITY PROTEIN: sugar phosphate isomerase/epimerase [Geomicrobium sp. JCM 19037]
MQQVQVERVSLNQITTEQWDVRQAIEGCDRHGVSWISLWRHKIQEVGIQETKRMLQAHGLQVSSLCRGGMFPARTKNERIKRIEDNKRAIDEAAELGAKVLVLVCGASGDDDLEVSRQWVLEGIEAILPYAASRGVQLGIEPLHPMYAADRSVIVTAGEANTLIEHFQFSHLGIVLDVFHIWWDPNIMKEIDRAHGKILGFHVSDWKVPMKDMFKGRAMMGDGVINIKKLRESVEKNGYCGPVEVEIINQDLWNQPGDDVLVQMKERFIEHV